MKYISTLFVAIALLAVGTVNAQSASKLNSQNYTYVMKDMNGAGPEIVDQLNFGVGKVTSQELARQGYAQGTVIEKNAGASSAFELNFINSTVGTYHFKGTAEGTTIVGTVTISNAKGTPVSELQFRGMLTEEWNHAVDRQKGAEVDEAVQKKMQQTQQK
jgi:hypothetical protein